MTRREDRGLVIEKAVAADPGAVLSYADLGILLGLDPVDERQDIRFTVQAAKRELLREHGKALVAERGEGYRVAYAGEHAGLARRAKSASDRKVRNAVELIEYADLSAMSDAERDAHARTRKAVLLLAHAHAQLSVRVAQHEERLSEIERAVFGE